MLEHVKRLFGAFQPDDEEDEVQAQAKVPSFLPPSSSGGLRNISDNGHSAANPKAAVLTSSSNNSSNGGGSDSLKLSTATVESSSGSGSSLVSAGSAIKDHWLSAGLVVKVVSRRVAEGRWYKVKGVVHRLLDRHSAEVRCSPPDGGQSVLVRLDQRDLETVVPSQPGSRVRIVNGAGAGLVAEIVELFPDKFRCDVLVVDRAAEDRLYKKVLRQVDYEHVCSFE